MLRRLTACLTAFLLLLAAAPVHAAEVDELAILSQWDERLYDSAFRYNNNYFRFGGCFPASAANGVIAALGVTDQDQAAGIFRDVLYLLTNNSPARQKVQIGRFSYLNIAPGELPENERYSTLNQTLQDFGGLIRYADTYMNAERLGQALAEIGGQKALLHGSLTRDGLWPNLCAMVETLIDAGHEDAVMVVASIGAGTASTRAPFRSGTSGHYLCLYLPVKSFSETGVFYVLDSMPRALEGEPYAPEMLYKFTYDFIGRQNYSTSLDDFNALFAVSRVLPTIVRVDPINEALDAVNAAQGGDVLPSSALMTYLDQVVTFFGTSHIFFTLPGQ